MFLPMYVSEGKTVLVAQRETVSAVKTQIHTKTCAGRSIVGSFITMNEIIPNSEQPQCPSTLDRPWYIDTMEYYSAV